MGEREGVSRGRYQSTIQVLETCDDKIFIKARHIFSFIFFFLRLAQLLGAVISTYYFYQRSS